MSFKGFLRGNTAATLMIGPFVDSTDGDTAETALTLSQADIRLSKNGGNMAQKNESTSCTHDELGKYSCPVDATDTNTYGRLDVTVHESGALISDDFYIVLAEPVYDSLCPAASGNPLPVFGVQDWGLAQVSASGTLVHRSGLSLADDLLNGAINFIYAGTGVGQARTAHDFTASNDTSSISPDWSTTPDATSAYVTFGYPPAATDASGLPNVNVTYIEGVDATNQITASVPTAVAIANEVLNAGQHYEQNVAADFFFVMVDSTDHVTRETGLTVTVTRSIDTGDSFGASAGTVNEVGNGVYRFAAAAGDLNGTRIVFRCTATGADPVEVAIKTYVDAS